MNKHAEEVNNAHRERPRRRRDVEGWVGVETERTAAQGTVESLGGAERRD